MRGTADSGLVGALWLREGHFFGPNHENTTLLPQFSVLPLLDEHRSPFLGAEQINRSELDTK